MSSVRVRVFASGRNRPTSQRRSTPTFAHTAVDDRIGTRQTDLQRLVNDGRCSDADDDDVNDDEQLEGSDIELGAG